MLAGLLRCFVEHLARTTPFASPVGFARPRFRILTECIVSRVGVAVRPFRSLLCCRELPIWSAESPFAGELSVGRFAT